MARTNRTWTSFGVAVVALLIGAWAAADPKPREPHADTRAALLAAGDAVSAERLQLASLAAAAAPARPDIAWLALASCLQVESCDVSEYEARLRTLDPGNGAAWMGTLTRAAAGTPQFQAGLMGIAASERFDIYWNPLIVHAADALKRTKTMKDEEAAILAIGLGAAQAIPALQPMSRACKADALAQQPEGLLTCRKLSSALRHGDAAIIEGLGSSVALRLWPASSDESRQAAEEIRVLHYRMHKGGELSATARPDEDADRYLTLLATHRTEQEALVANLVAAGIDPNPPAGWTEPAL